MLNNQQFRKCIIRPALTSVGLYSADAEELLIATMAHESLGGTYLVQHPPAATELDASKLGALGVYQMETPTHNDIWERTISKRSNLEGLILRSCNYNEDYLPTSLNMIWDMRYATIMARMFWIRIAAPIPHAQDINAIWEYYKKYWNTHLGAAKKEQFIQNYTKFNK